MSESPDLTGKNFEEVVYTQPAAWHGFAREARFREVYEWADGGGKTVLAVDALETRWVFRGWSSKARKPLEEIEQSGLMPGAVMTPLEDDDG